MPMSNHRPIYNGSWYWGRPTTNELHQDLRAITRRIRPAWQIDTPELHATWDGGARKAFDPYENCASSCSCSRSFGQ